MADDAVPALKRKAFDLLTSGLLAGQGQQQAPFTLRQLMENFSGGTPLNPTADQRTKLYEINELATNYFQEILRHHPSAQPARDYLERRGIDPATQNLFRLGYALD